MFDGIAEHKGRNRDFVLRNRLFFLLFLFNLFLLIALINKC